MNLWSPSRQPISKPYPSTPPFSPCVSTYIRGVGFSLDDVEDGNVTALFARRRRYHPILGLQQPPHHIEHRRLPDRLGLLDIVPGKRRVRRHEKVTTRRRDQRRHDPDQVIVHVARISERRCTGRHDSGDLYAHQMASRREEKSLM